MAGTLVMIGTVLSVTVTSWVALAVLPAGSVAVHVMVVAPTTNVLPAGTRVTVTVPELSEAVAVPSVALLTVVEHAAAPGPVKAVTATGAVIVGAVLSTTVIVCARVAKLPAASVALNVRVMIIGLAGVPAPPLLASSTDRVGVPQLSLAVASPATAAGTPLKNWKLALAGTLVIVGGVPSVIVTSCVALAVLSDGSLAV